MSLGSQWVKEKENSPSGWAAVLTGRLSRWGWSAVCTLTKAMNGEALTEPRTSITRYCSGFSLPMLVSSVWFSSCSSCWPDSKQARNFRPYPMMHKRLFCFSFLGEPQGHPVLHYSGWNIDNYNPHQPLRLGVLSCPCTFMFWPALVPLVWLRKCCADARWPKDLCLLLMLRKALFWSGIVVQSLRLFFFFVVFTLMQLC